MSGAFMQPVGWCSATQDEMIEIQEREEQQAVDEKQAAEKAVHNALMKEANLDGVESLVGARGREGAG